MERIQVLIDKLSAQVQSGEAPHRLLLTVQLLQQELIRQQDSATPAAQGKVAVVMPAAFALPVTEAAQEPQPQPVKTLFNIPESDKRFLPSEPEVPAAPSYKDLLHTASPAPEPYILRKPIIEPTPRKEVPEEPKEIFQLDETPYEEAPTLVQHAATTREVHEAIGQKAESLNDRLKGGTTELVQKLSGEPIKDLRKGIALNDKFVFISELFRGDEAMYERSIKTINAFHILPEAEYWMNRELKVKLGWNDSHTAVQHFYAIVRRRFA